MDANGTKFHLLKGTTDWQQCRETPDFATTPPPDWTAAEWDNRRQSVRLRSRLTLFRTPQSQPMPLALRRAADRDAYGSTFWIADNQQEIIWIPAAENAPLSFWTQETLAKNSGDTFQPVAKTAPAPLKLAGLAVNSEHYLVVGYHGAAPTDEKGLLIFDLHKGGTPTRQIFPGDFVFQPFEMSADAQGNVWILDRTNRQYWGLDKNFHLMGQDSGIEEQQDQAGDFVPLDGSALPKSLVPPALIELKGFAIQEIAAVSIEAIGSGIVLILDSPGLPDSSANSPVSTLSRYRFGTRLGDAIPLVAHIETVIDETNNVQDHFNVIGYDMGFTTNETGSFLAVVEQDGKQAILFQVAGDALNPMATLTLQALTDYLPLLSFGGLGLIRRDNTLFYDISAEINRDTQTRWTPIETIDQPHFGTEATLYTPVFDGKAQDCVWHRLLLDACIPPETEITILSRCANSREILEAVPFSAEPAVYQRDDGSEIPFYRPFCDRNDTDFGTFETVFQAAQGQYLQLEIKFSGTGRVSPNLYHLRAYYPRFSYPKNYLPAIYNMESESFGFLERFLANAEGFYTEIEDKINDVGMLFDARSVPPEALDWLAGWYGLTLDPLWQNRQDQRARFGAELFGGTVRLPDAILGECGGRDRRRLLIRFARHLYERRGTLEGLRFALNLLLNPCLEETLELLKQIASLPDTLKVESAIGSLAPALARLIQDLRKLGLPLPTPTTSELEFEDLLYRWVVSEIRPSAIRIVERFRTRGGRAGVAGDTSQIGNTASSAVEPFRSASHRFTVLLPQGIEPEIEAMVRRIVQLEKPAHTLFEYRTYWEGFRIGEARLGLETVLGRSPQFETILLGRSALSEGYLSAKPPLDTPDRVIADRDRVNDMPILR